MEYYLRAIVEGILTTLVVGGLAALARPPGIWLRDHLPRRIKERLPALAAFLRPALPYFMVVAVCTALGLAIRINGIVLRLEAESAMIREALIAEPLRFKPDIGRIFSDCSNGPSQRLKARGKDKEEWPHWEVIPAPTDSFAFRYWNDDVPEQPDERAGGVLFLIEQIDLRDYRGVQIDIRVTDMQCPATLSRCQADMGVRLAVEDSSGRDINAWEIGSLAKARVDLGAYWQTIKLDRGDFTPMTPDTSPAPSLINKIAFFVKKDHVRNCEQAKIWVRHISLLRAPAS